ncbi:MAG: hypothetical protein IKS20_04380 [Victivallales bacterium]|nr:hypothetical protein [Victivallales bacterium]
MKRLCFVMLSLLCCMAARALTVSAPSSPIVVDGKLDEAAWKAAVKTTGFIRLKSQAEKPMKDQTEFSMLADDEAVYIGIACLDSNIGKLKWAGSVWTSDSVEIFLSPAGNPVEYYHFAVGCQNDTYAMFRAEGGNITPDKYAPFWQSAVSKDDKAWYLEVKIPYSAFYMTRNKMWNKTWLVNICRNQSGEGGPSTWAPLNSKYHESKVFKPVEGFPMRKGIEDVYIPVVRGDFLSQEGDVIKGNLTVNVEGTAEAVGYWDMTVEVPDGGKATQQVRVEHGNSKFVVKGLDFPASQKSYHKVKVTLRNGNVELGRCYPVEAEYKPIDIKITWPQYANNYYPGQDATRLAGQVRFKLSEADAKKAVIELKVGDKSRKLKAKGDRMDFEEKFPELKEGQQLALSARLIVDGKESASVQTCVKRLPPPEKGGEIVWVQDGRIVRDGKPYFPRFIAAYKYRGGRRLTERFEKDNDYICQNEFAHYSLEPFRLLPKMNIEAKEATKDVKPCDELFVEVQKVIDRHRGENFIGYYICDEPECRDISPVYLRYIYEYVKKADPYHVVLTCTRSPQRYIECADVFMMHTYIAPMFSGNGRFLSTPIEKVRAQIHEVRDLKRPEKVAGFTGQFFTYKFNNKYADYPTWDELQAQTWTAIANGSMVHFPYAFHDIDDKRYMFEAFVYQNQAIMELNDLLLSDKVKSLPIKAEKQLDCTLFEHNGMKLLLMVNPYPEACNATLEDKAVNGTWHEYRGEAVCKLAKGQTVKFAPNQVYILTSRPFASKFAPTKEVLAKIKAYEDSVNNKGNLLLNKGDTFELDASEVYLVGNATRKICDGSTDMLAWGCSRWKKQQWFEMDFPRVSPKFKTIKIYGYNLKNASFTILKAGEWKTITPVEVKEDAQDWSKTFTFDNVYKTVKLRISFNDLKVGQDDIELYEIEMYNP